MSKDDRGRGAAVEVLRGERVESEHRIAFAIMDAHGRSIGGQDAARAIYPRSSLKPIQALPLLTSGAAERFEVSDAELALACASHAGEPMHLEIVEAWRRRVDVDPEALACGAHPPTHGPSAAALLKAGETPGKLHNNCSGKHLGMLVLARHLGAPAAGYHEPGHPVQLRISEVVARMAGLERLPAPAVDGCSVPTWPMPLQALSTAMARLADPTGLEPGLAGACERIRRVMAAHPELVAGTHRADTLIMQAAPGLIVKSGAEGVSAAALPDRGLGVALKVLDGAARAVPVAMLALLSALGALGPASLRALERLARPAVRNHAGLVVGSLREAPGWPGSLG